MYKVGIFGTGKLGKLHLNHWNEIPGVSIAGFFDPNNETAAEVESRYAIKRYTSEEELIDDSDIIDVTCPTTAHFAICEKAIRKGRHVFVEKPMVHTMSEAEDLVKLVQESKVKLQVGHAERFNPALFSLNEVQLAPMYMEVHRLARFNPHGSKVSVVMDLMIHDIDMVLSLVHSEVKHVSASGVAVLHDNPDVVNARIEFNNGCVANLTSSRIAPEQKVKMQLFQKDSFIDIDFLEKKATLTRLEGSDNDHLSSFDLEISNEAHSTESLSPGIPEAAAVKREFRGFVAAIRNNTRTVVNEIDGYRAMEVAHQILKKITTNLSTAR